MELNGQSRFMQVGFLNSNHLSNSSTEPREGQYMAKQEVILHGKKLEEKPVY